MARRIRARVGADAAIVDVNDLGRVDVTAYAGKVEPEAFRAALADNPAGNDDQRTPIVVLKKIKAPPDRLPRSGYRH